MQLIQAKTAPSMTAADVALKLMSARQLREHAASRGIGADEIEDARDTEDPKAALMQLIQAKSGPPPPGATGGPARGELRGPGR